MASILPYLYVATSAERGRGVYTAQAIPAASVLELCPIILLSARDRKLIHDTVLHDYYFLWGDQGEAVIALGYGSLYNHASDPNASYEMLISDQQIRFFAQRDIAVGEEITVSYSKGGIQSTELWFSVE